MYSTNKELAAPSAMNPSTIRLSRSLRKRSISFGVCMLAVNGMAKPTVAMSIASTLLYARAMGLRESTSLALVWLAQLSSFTTLSQFQSATRFGLSR